MIQGWNAVCYKRQGWLYVLDDKKPIVVGRENDTLEVKVKNTEGYTLLKWKSACAHVDDNGCQYSCIKCQTKSYVAEACRQCRHICIYDLATQKAVTKFSLVDIHLDSMCRGPGGDSLLMLDNVAKSITQLRWTTDSQKLTKERSITLLQELHGCGNLCYMKENDSIAMTSTGANAQKEENAENKLYIILSVALSSGAILWQYGGSSSDTLAKTLTQCHGLHYSKRKLFIGEKSRMLILDSTVGKLEKIVSEEQIDSLQGLLWNLHLAHMKTTDRRHIRSVQVREFSIKIDVYCKAFRSSKYPLLYKPDR